ncbi:phytoene desaturase family protein [Williamsia serinedens]|uniref:Pyridine nucleotide-disulfide oxidoreductase domain-containing protein 2 n=1 Tax=Williamsia serinedens TaxID=391736 RepID=A0ABT1GZG0_9NOCA|nr:NAD(P)/FAD-dependent oxidoreductase [Williamsia serinedens]MCP2159745.1 Phytoene dehydrogenase-related protein [Williamsia serinedens]
MGDTTDAVVVGSGINGLVAAALLADAGWSVRLVERSESIGGFIDSGERTVPGYVHDTYSSWHPLFVTGGAYAELGDDLHRHGLEYRNTDDLVTASVAADGRATVAHRDPSRTEFADPADQRRYLEALDAFGADVDLIGGILGSEFRSGATVSAVTGLLRRNRVDGVEALVRDAVSSGRGWCRREFVGTEVDRLWVPWLLHSGLAPDSASGGLMIPIFAATMHGAGLPIVAGGAARFVDAFRSLLVERGVVIETGADVEAIEVSGGRAVGVRFADGRRFRASRAVIASVSPGALYGQLLPSEVAGGAATVARRFRPGRAAMQIHVALDRAPRWRDSRLDATPLVHLSDGSATTAVACAQAEAGLLPGTPTVVVGQQFVIDPSRVPDGAGSLWIQLQEVPFAPIGDAAGTIHADGRWTPDVTRAYVDRVLDRIEQQAPGLQASIVGIDTITPPDLQAHNVNAENGDPYGGSAELDQNFLWRPAVGRGSHRTAVPGLWHIGASTHPGPGLGGGSGVIVAQSLTTPPVTTRVRDRLRGMLTHR